MHAGILGVALAAVAGAALAAGDDAPNAPARSCPRVNAAVLERFISAECEACWTDASVARPDASEWLLDWIVPSSRGDEAPLSSAAPREALSRARRVLKGEPASRSCQRAAQRSAHRHATAIASDFGAGVEWLLRRAGRRQRPHGRRARACGLRWSKPWPPAPTAAQCPASWCAHCRGRWHPATCATASHGGTCKRCAGPDGQASAPARPRVDRRRCRPHRCDGRRTVRHALITHDHRC